MRQYVQLTTPYVSRLISLEVLSPCCGELHWAFLTIGTLFRPSVVIWEILDPIIVTVEQRDCVHAGAELGRACFIPPDAQHSPFSRSWTRERGRPERL